MFLLPDAATWALDSGRDQELMPLEPAAAPWLLPVAAALEASPPPLCRLAAEPGSQVEPVAVRIAPQEDTAAAGLDPITGLGSSSATEGEAAPAAELPPALLPDGGRGWAPWSGEEATPIDPEPVAGSWDPSTGLEPRLIVDPVPELELQTIEPVDVRVQFVASEQGWAAYLYSIRADGELVNVLVIASYDEPNIARLVKEHSNTSDWLISDTGDGWLIADFPLDLAPPVPDRGVFHQDQEPIEDSETSDPQISDPQISDPLVSDPLGSDPELIDSGISSRPGSPDDDPTYAAYQAFVAENPLWPEQNGAGGIQAQVISASAYLPWIELATPGAALAFDRWYEQFELPLQGSVEGGVVSWLNPVVCTFLPPDATEEKGQLAEDPTYAAYQAFVAENPLWPEQNGAGGIQAQVISASAYLPWIELATPGAALAFDRWYEQFELPLQGSVEGGVVSWLNPVVCTFLPPDATEEKGELAEDPLPLISSRPELVVPIETRARGERPGPLPPVMADAVGPVFAAPAEPSPDLPAAAPEGELAPLPAAAPPAGPTGAGFPPSPSTAIPTDHPTDISAGLASDRSTDRLTERSMDRSTVVSADVRVEITADSATGLLATDLLAADRPGADLPATAVAAAADPATDAPATDAPGADVSGADVSVADVSAMDTATADDPAVDAFTAAAPVTELSAMAAAAAADASPANAPVAAAPALPAASAAGLDAGPDPLVARRASTAALPAPSAQAGPATTAASAPSAAANSDSAAVAPASRQSTAVAVSPTLNPAVADGRLASEAGQALLERLGLTLHRSWLWQPGRLGRGARVAGGNR